LRIAFRTRRKQKMKMSDAHRYSPMRELVAVQLIRGVAATGVALSHAFAAAALPQYFGVELVDGWLDIGRSGVELFFVLSGFLMYTIHLKDFSQPNRVMRYVARRFIRIYPIYWIFVSTMIATLFAVNSISRLSIADFLTIYSLVRVSDVTLPLGVAWTLFHEMIFYVTFAFFLLNRRIGLLVFCLWFTVVAWLRITPGPTMISIALSEINILFGFGVLVGWIFNRIVVRYGGIIFVLGVASYGMTFKFLEHHNPQPEFILRTTGYGMSGCLILYGLLCIEANGGLKALSVPRLLGDASYTIYLMHFPFIAALFKMAAYFGILRREWSEFSTVGVGAVAIGLSVGLYLLVERPLQSWLNRILFANAEVRRSHRADPKTC
jgi:exopolysaccharide production protein ExoZ